MRGAVGSRGRWVRRQGQGALRSRCCCSATLDRAEPAPGNGHTHEEQHGYRGERVSAQLFRGGGVSFVVCAAPRLTRQFYDLLRASSLARSPSITGFAISLTPGIARTLLNSSSMEGRSCATSAANEVFPSAALFPRAGFFFVRRSLRPGYFLPLA